MYITVPENRTRIAHIASNLTRKLLKAAEPFLSDFSDIVDVFSVVAC